MATAAPSPALVSEPSPLAVEVEAVRRAATDAACAAAMHRLADEIRALPPAAVADLRAALAAPAQGAC